MPRDPRLYMTFPNDFHRHPKLLKLPPEIRWTFVEMNGEARIADNDGRFSAEDAEFMWPVEHLDALVHSHPKRPLVVRERDGGDYVIREYAEHQQTRAERERLAEISRQNGRKGGRPRKNPDQIQTEPAQVSADAEVSPAVGALASQAGITSLQSVIDSVRKHAHRNILPDGAFQVGLHLIEKAKQHPRNPQMYVTRSISLSPFEVQQFVDERALAVTS